jgi:Protein of unknown function (DUF4239)
MIARVLGALTPLYTVPSWVLLVLVVGGSAALACAGLLAVRKAYPNIDFRQHNEVAGIVIGIAGGLFAVTLSFIIAIVWQEFDATSQRVSIEAAAATDVWHVSAGLSPSLAREVRTVLRDYANTMVREEWPAMRRGASSAHAEAVLTQAFEDVARFRPANAGESNAQSAALQHLAELHDARHHRLDDNVSGVSPFEWVILFIGAVVVIGFCCLVGTADLRAQLIMTGAVAALIAAMFVLVFQLDYPFRGDLSVSPDPWLDFIKDSRNGL